MHACLESLSALHILRKWLSFSKKRIIVSNSQIGKDYSSTEYARACYHKQ